MQLSMMYPGLQSATLTASLGIRLARLSDNHNRIPLALLEFVEDMQGLATRYNCADTQAVISNLR